MGFNDEIVRYLKFTCDNCGKMKTYSGAPDHADIHLEAAMDGWHLLNIGSPARSAKIIPIGCWLCSVCTKQLISSYGFKQSSRYFNV